MFEEILSRVGSALKAHSIPYMIIGGQAVLLYGEPRLTRDIDILKKPDIDKEYIRRWLKEFDASSDEKTFLKTFETLLKN